MKPPELGDILESGIDKSSVCAGEDTPYFRAAAEIMEMAVAYRKDGLTFFRRGDLVNAHASFAYGLGWLDFGILSGLIKGENPGVRLAVFEEEMPDDLLPHLFEKTNRYKRMLSGAADSVSYAPDRESPLHDFSKRVVLGAEGFLKKGDAYLSDEKFVNALAHFSYGYGLLDAAVRCGLLIITKNRELFTV